MKMYIEISDFSIDEKQIAALIKIVDEGKVANTIETKKSSQYC